jgi:hypothetical protein
MVILIQEWDQRGSAVARYSNIEMNEVAEAKDSANHRT